MINKIPLDNKFAIKSSKKDQFQFLLIYLFHLIKNTIQLLVSRVSTCMVKPTNKVDVMFISVNVI